MVVTNLYGDQRPRQRLKQMTVRCFQFLAITLDRKFVVGLNTTFPPVHFDEKHSSEFIVHMHRHQLKLNLNLNQRLS